MSTTKTSKKTLCKLCLQSVTKKTGIPCTGPCKAWIHYDCLKYAPDKIKEFKAGRVMINCPCPDCDPEAKEIRLDQGYNCTNEECVVNKPPNPDGTNNVSAQVSKDGNRWPIAKCGKECKTYSNIRPPVPCCKSCTSATCGVKRAMGEGVSDPDIAEIEKMCKQVRVITQQLDEMAVKIKEEAKKCNECKKRNRY